MNSDNLARILQYLSTGDLLECCTVSQCWRREASHQLKLRTHQPLAVFLSKRKHHNASLLRQFLITNQRKLSFTALKSKFKFSAVLSFGDGSAPVLADDNLFLPHLTLSSRWIFSSECQYTLTDLQKFKCCLATPLVATKAKGMCHLGACSLGKPFPLVPPNGNKPFPLVPPNGNSFTRQTPVMDAVMSLYSLDRLVVGVWSDTKKLAFVVVTTLFSLDKITESFHIRIPRSLTQNRHLDNHGLSAHLVLRNFRTTIVHEIFWDLFIEDGTLKGIDSNSFSNIRLRKDKLGILWKTENFRGRVKDSIIVELVLKHNKMFSKDNPWDLTDYSLSCLTVLEPLSAGDSRLDHFNCSLNNGSVLRAKTACLTIEIVFSLDDGDEHIIARDLNIYAY